MTDKYRLAVIEALAIQGIHREFLGNYTRLDSLGLDDLDRVEIAMTLEKELGIKIDDSKMDRKKTVNDLILMIRNLCNE